ncbi:MAG: hypothetical protein WCR87_03130 [Saccharofermentanales bacterium]
MDKTKKIPVGALRFIQNDNDACVKFAKNEDGTETPKLNMLAYSGKPIENHWWWDTLVIDTDGVKFNQKKYPILEDHDTRKKIAFTGKPKTENYQIVIDPDTTVFVDTDESRAFQSLSKDGFPYQASIYATPTSIEYVQDGESADVNGFSIKGPASIWRKSEFHEASACVFGADSKTMASAFSKTETQELTYEVLGEHIEQLNNEEVKTTMDMDTLKKEHPDLVKQIEDSAVTDAQNSFSKEKEGLQCEVTKLQTQLSTSEDKILQLEKKDALREERERAVQRDAEVKGIWSEKLSASDVAEFHYAKIQKMVNPDKFTKEGVFDAEAFSKAVDAEIPDWENIVSNTEVMGFSSGTSREVDSDAKKKEKFAKENEDASNGLLALIGQKPAT